MFFSTSLIQSLLTLFHLNWSIIFSRIFLHLMSPLIFTIFLIKLISNLLVYITNSVVFGLQNNLASIHPLIILLGYSFLLQLYILNKSHHVITDLNLGVCLGYFTLGLGGWWAFQEFNWGGWWNWDSIETPILFLLMYYSLQLFHLKKTSVSSLLRLITSFNIFPFILTLIILLPRFGLTNSIHTFISLNTNYINYYSLYIYQNIFFIPILFILKTIQLWSFLWVKYLLAYIFCLLFTTIIFCKKPSYFNIFHKLVYKLTLLTILTNYKLLSISIHTSTSTLLTHSYKIFPNQSLFFWIKPLTCSITTNFYSLKFFFN